MKRKKAAALRYEKNFNVPKITAIGFGQIAEKIIKTAISANVPVVENNELVDNLCRLSLDSSIPPELYEAVAEIIAFIYQINDEKKI